MKEEHYTNGFKTKVWNSLFYSKDGISQKISDMNNRWISIIPNIVDKNSIEWEYKYIDYIVDDSFTENDISDIDLFISLSIENYFSNIEDLLLYLKNNNINNAFFESSWKLKAPI